MGKRLEILQSMAGPTLSWNIGDVVEIEDTKHAKRLIEAGIGVETKKAITKKAILSVKVGPTERQRIKLEQVEADKIAKAEAEKLADNQKLIAENNLVLEKNKVLEAEFEALNVKIEGFEKDNEELSNKVVQLSDENDLLAGKLEEIANSTVDGYLGEEKEIKQEAVQENLEVENQEDPEVEKLDVVDDRLEDNQGQEQELK